MIVEDMNAVIQGSCRNCTDCRIHDICIKIGGDFLSNPKECEEAYNILTGIKEHTDVNHPSHYNQGGIECIDAMVAAFGKEAVATWSKLNAFKYIWRAEHKNGIQDIDKAIWYLTKFKELNVNE